jgi:phosphotransacetylase/acyl dehydratase
MEYIENKTFDEIKIGDSANLKRVLTAKDIELFAIVSGDINPAHLDEKYASTTRFTKVIGHGMWGASLISAVLGTKLPGPGAIYLNQTLNFKKPVFIDDCLIVNVTVISKNEEKKRIEFSCQCVNQNNEEVITGTATILAPAEKIKLEKILLPEVILKNTSNPIYERLLNSVKEFKPLVTGVVHPVDELSLLGAIASAEAKIITPIFIGPENKIRDLAATLKIDLSPYQIIGTKHSHEAAEVAVSMAKDGKVEALMKGKIHTEELMTAIVDKEKGLRTGRRMSHIFAIDVPNYYKPLFLTDAALNIAPTLSDKVDIVQNAIDLFTTIGLGTPKVAILSAEENVTEKIPSTLDATALCKMADREQITGGLVDGPLAFDSAISMESVKVKGIKSPVAGDADIVVVPDVESGNMLYKQATYLYGEAAAGIVMGATVPIILTSRGSDVLSRKASSAMALLFMRRKELNPS